jgi:hypothetical protein
MWNLLIMKNKESLLTQVYAAAAQDPDRKEAI